MSDQVLLHLPARTKWKFKEMAALSGVRAHDHYLCALVIYLRAHGHISEAQELVLELRAPLVRWLEENGLAGGQR